MIQTKYKSKRISSAIAIFKKPAYTIIAISSAIAFFYLFRYLVSVNNDGLFLIFIPIYLIYALVATSGVLFSISIFTIAHSISMKRSGAVGGIEGILLPSIGGLIVGCGCSFPLLESILLFFGVGVFQAVGIISILNGYQYAIIAAMIALNIIAIYYYLGRLQQPPRRRKRF